MEKFEIRCAEPNFHNPYSPSADWVALAGQHLPLIRLDKPHLQYDNTQGKGSSAPQLSVKKRNYSSLLPTLQVSSMRLPFQPEALVYCGAKLARDLVGL